jgi:hypothetical protein
MTVSRAPIRHRAVPWLLAGTLMAAAYTVVIAATGGFSLEVAGVRLRSHSWMRPAVLAGTGALVLAFLTRARLRILWAQASRAGQATRFAAALAMAATAWTLAAGILFGTYANGGSDSYGYVGQARLLTQGKLTDTVPMSADYVWPDVEVTLTPLGFTVGKSRGVIAPVYPPGLALLLAPFAGWWETGVYLVVPAFGALLVWLTYRLGCSIGDPAAGAIAAVLLSVSPTFLYQLVQPMSDVPAAACWLAALLLGVRGTMPATALSGAACSVAILIRPNLAPLAGLVAAAATFSTTEIRLRRLLLFAVALAPGLIVLGWIQHVRYGSPLASGYGTFSDGFDTRNIVPNLARYPRWLTETHTWFIWLSLAAPLWILRRVRRRMVAWAAVAFAMATWAAYLPYTYFQAHEWFYTRFLLLAIAVMLLLASGVALSLVRRLPEGWRLAATLLLVSVLGGVSLSTARTHRAFDIRTQERKYPLAGQFVRDQLPETAFVLALQHSGSIRYYANRPTLRWDLLSPAHLDQVLTILRAQGYEPFLVVDAGEYENFRQKFLATDQRAVRQLTLLAIMGDARVFAFK